MNSRTIVFTLLILCLMIVCAHAQEKLTTEEIFRYFPLANYTSISHYDFSKIKNEEALELYELYLRMKQKNGSRPSIREPLPHSFNVKEASFTRARLDEYLEKTVVIPAIKSVEEKGAANRKIKKNYGEIRYYKLHPVDEDQKEQKITFQYNVGDSFGVYRLNNLPVLLKEALAKGEIEETSETIHKLPVYIYTADDYRTHDRTKYFACATAFDEFLVAKKLKTIRNMISAGFGMRASILDEARYLDLNDIMPEMGYATTIFFHFADVDAQREQLKSLGATEEQQKKIINKVISAPSIRILTGDIGAEWTSKIILVFRDENAARSAGNTYDPSYRIGASEKDRHFDSLRVAKTTTKRVGNWRIMTTVRDEEYIKADFARFEESYEAKEKDPSEK